ncbi:CBASS oligonucleotide cyclase [Algiphilus sp. W345]|uniref:CBASS oligonucleotide cyclase n=1 Tax=Banduia mediterranea TaxID=3075609 RepID=A0ABU2WL15_9GAMM|nr:CBASS oligonucleotide cyclase [Algiphilus sp. W345]MDT0498577.1 CBASS oligonucleotide cyclase [Algiphilus sp. W345]
MALSNAQLLWYDSNVLRLPQDKRTEYHAQVDRLISELRKHMADFDELTIKKVMKAGSFAKFTILRKTNEDPVDVDVMFYLTGDNVSHKTFKDLSDVIYAKLAKIYPTKKVEDFELQRRAATVQFVGSGLAVDIVPVLQDPKRPDYGWQFDIQDGSKNETCAPCQIQFVVDRKKQDAHFRTLVRLAKRWKNYTTPSGLKSFHIELIMAHLLEVDGSGGSIEKRFRDFLLYVAQSELKERVDFVENRKSPAFSFADPVVVIDPVNNSNNVTSRISETERKEICQTAQNSWEVACRASEDDDLDAWKEVFGPRFKVKEEE